MVNDSFNSFIFLSGEPTYIHMHRLGQPPSCHDPDNLKHKTTQEGVLQLDRYENIIAIEQKPYTRAGGLGCAVT
jgi:hypothetical protein